MIIPLARDAPKGVGIVCWQPGKVARLDCRTFACVALEHTLPWVPVFTAVDLEQGEFRMEPPSPAQAAELIVGKTYPLRVQLRNALGAGVEVFDLTVQAL